MSVARIISTRNVLSATVVGLLCIGQAALADIDRGARSGGNAVPATQQDKTTDATALETAPNGGSVAGGSVVPWTDGFEAYTDGQLLDGTPDDGGWKGWDNTAAAFGTVTSAQTPHGGALTVDINGPSDLVHEYCGATGGTGTWTFSAWIFIPTNFVGQTYLILLNTYSDGGTKNWSTQISYSDITGQWLSDFDGGTVAGVTGQWVSIVVVIDLTLDTQDIFIDGSLLASKGWTDGVSGGGVLDIAAVDLFANNATVVYYDDMSLAGGTPVAEDCTDGADNDCDALVDCDDPDCDTDPACQPIVGACCLPDDSCVQKDDVACAAQNGTFFPGGDCAMIDCTAAPIPTVSEWGLIALMLLLLAGAGVVIRRRGAAPA